MRYSKGALAAHPIRSVLFLMCVYGPLAVFPISESDQLLYGDAKNVSTQRYRMDLLVQAACPVRAAG
jgi:hypothetical protein